MLQFIAQDQQIRKKVFFKPELSSEVKFTPLIAPNFINDTTLLYMSAYDFMQYDTDEETFTLIHRPLPQQNESSTEQFINVNFGRDGRQRINEIFYLIKCVSLEQQAYYLGRRINSVNHEYDKKLIARNKKQRKKKFTISDIDNRGNVKNKGHAQKIVDDQIPNGVLQFKKEFIVKQSLSLIIFVVKKEVIEPQIKLSIKQIPEEQQLVQPNEQFANPSPPSTEQIIMQEKTASKQKQYKNCLLIHSYAHNQTMTFQLDESIESAFEIVEGSPNIVCVSQKYVYLVNFEVKNTYMAFQPTSNYDLDDDSRTYQNAKRGFLNSDIKIQILDKVELEFQIKTEGTLPRNLISSHPSSKSTDKKSGKKKNRRNRSVAHNSIVKDRRVSSLLLKGKRKSEAQKPSSAMVQMKVRFKDQEEQQRMQFFQQIKNLQKIPSMKKTKTIQQQDQQLCQSVKIIKKALKVLPLSFHQQQFILIVYVVSKVISTPESIQTLSFHYESSILAVQSPQLVEVNVTEFLVNNCTDTFFNSTNNSNVDRFADDVGREFKNVFEFVEELGDVVAHKGVIIVWEKNLPVMHEIRFKVDYRASEMLDLSEPKNLKTQKSIISSVSYVLEYHNKITLHLNSNLIKEIIISPSCQNFFLLTGRSHQNTFRESQLDELDTRSDLDQKYDIDDYLIFQYDLFAQLWSSDANVYLKNIPLSYHKRKVEEIAPFRMKNEVLALTGKRVHELHKSLLDGILYFDLHPYGYFIAVSFGFNAKIYSLEHSTLNLIYTYNSQNIKKIKYSPNGSDLVIMSQKNIKILDSYSFSIKYILQEKSAQCSFTNFGYSFSGMDFYTVYDNIFINVHEGQSYAKVNMIKPGGHSSSLLSFHDKIVTIIPQTQEKFCLVLLETGKIYFKWNEDVIAIKHEFLFEYKDEKMIRSVHYDAKRGVLFCGLSNGCVRGHIWPIKNEASYNFNVYSEFKFGYSEITSLNTSYLTNTLYVGDENGNLTTAKFIIEKEKKITGQIRPNNYYIFSSHSPLVNMPKTQLQALEKCYKYVLSSNTTSMAESPQKLKLEYKLNEIITRMNEQMKKFKKVMRQKLIEKEGLAKNKLNFNKLYNDTKSKLSDITHQLKLLKERELEERTQLNADYEAKLKKIIEQQNQLVKQKGLELSKNFMAKTFLRHMNEASYQELRKKQEKLQNQYSSQGIKGMQLMMRQQQLVPYDQIDYLPNWTIQVKKEFIQKLDQDLKHEQQRNYELKQACTYMQNSKNNLQMGRIKQQTIMFRIDLELQEMQQKLNYQNRVHDNLGKELKQAQDKINRTQEQVIQRNPQFTKVVNGSGVDDGCTYKLWVKDRMAEEVQLLYNHYNTLGDIMEQKQVDIIEMVSFKKNFIESVESLGQKKQKMKKYLHFLKDHITSTANKINHIKNNCGKYEYLENKQRQEKQKQEELQKAMQKQNCFQQTKGLNFAIMDLIGCKPKDFRTHDRKASSLTARPHTKDQDTIVKQKKQGHKILLQNSANKKIFQKRLLQEAQKDRNNIIKNMMKKQLSTEMRFKIDKLVEEIDTKVKGEWNTLENEKLNIAAPFKSSSNTNLSKRVKKLKSEKKLSDTSSSFTAKLLEKLKEKEQSEQESQKCDKAKEQLKSQERIIPFSATSSPVIKHISSQFNLYQKSSKFLKNHAKIQQRKIKRLNGEKAQLLSEFEELKYENKCLADKQAIFKDGISVVNDILASTSPDGMFVSDSDKQVQVVRKTPFQKYVQEKSKKISPNNTMTSFKVTLSTQRTNFMKSQRSSRIKLNMTAFNSPKKLDSPMKITTKTNFSKKN